MIVVLLRSSHDGSAVMPLLIIHFLMCCNLLIELIGPCNHLAIENSTFKNNFTQLASYHSNNTELTEQVFVT